MRALQRFLQRFVQLAASLLCLEGCTRPPAADEGLPPDLPDEGAVVDTGLQPRQEPFGTGAWDFCRPSDELPLKDVRVEEGAPDFSREEVFLTRSGCIREHREKRDGAYRSTTLWVIGTAPDGNPRFRVSGRLAYVYGQRAALLAQRKDSTPLSRRDAYDYNGDRHTLSAHYRREMLANGALRTFVQRYHAATDGGPQGHFSEPEVHVNPRGSICIKTHSESF